MMEWSAVLYVTGKRNADTLRRHLRTRRVTLIVDARVPLVYSKRIDAAYLPLVRRKLWKATLVTSPGTSRHWMQVLDVKSRPTRPLGWNRVWILTGLGDDIEERHPVGLVPTLLSRIDTEMRRAPEDLIARKVLRLGVYHEDLGSREIGFAALGLALNRFFATSISRDSH